METLAWHFVCGTLRDGRPIPADGEKLIHTGRLIPCESGLHWSERLIDALEYAPGATLCQVAVSGEIVRQDDKGVSTERTILWRIDATDVLRKFARRCALDVAHLWDMPPVVRRFLETGDETIRAAARDAARDARDAAWAAQAARDAAWAAWAAAWAAAPRAARAAPRAAQGAAQAARDAWAARAARAARDARDAQSTQLEAMVNDARDAA